MLIRRSLVLVGVLALVAAASTREPRPTEAPQPSAVTFSKDELTLMKALAEVRRQTGNVLVDRRSNMTDPKLTLNPKAGTYWQILDAIGSQTGIGFSAYQPNGGVALVDTPYRRLTTHYSGIFRFTVKRIAVSRDEETQAHLCRVTLDAAWEPRFKALYVNLDQATAVFGKRSESVEQESATPVFESGASATEIELRMNAPGRTTAKIDSVQGTIHVIGVPKMLEFAFPKLLKGAGPPLEVQEGVKVSVTEVNWTSSKANQRWTVDVLAEYPEGAIAPLESFQSWTHYNRVWLTWGIDPQTKKPYELEPSGRKPLDTRVGTKTRYQFTPREGTPVPPAGAEVTLRYRTPNRVVRITVPFAFRDLPLP
jgi:hypothetical protein